MDTAISVAGVPIRLTAERWLHVGESHDDLAGHYDDVLATVESPEYIVQGHGGSLIALRSLGRMKWLAVAYREVSPEDGFVITAYITSRSPRRRALWKSK